MSKFVLDGSNVINSAIGTENTVTNRQGGTHNEENYTINASGGNVGTVGRSSGPQYFGQISARSETQEDSRNQSSIQDTESQPIRQVTSDLGEEVRAAFVENDYEVDGDLPSILDFFEKNGVRKLKHLEYLEVSDLVEGGIKLVQARILKSHYEASKGKVLVNSEVDAEESYIKKEDDANRKQSSTTGQRNSPNRNKLN